MKASYVFEVYELVSIPEGGNQIIHAWTTTAAPTLFALFADTAADANISFWQTKLWDGGVPLQDKEVIRVGLGMTFPTLTHTSPTVTTDNEYNSEPTPLLNKAEANTLNFVSANGPLQFQNASALNIWFYVTGSLTNYSFLLGTGTTTGGKYYGISCQANLTNLVYSFAAIEYRSTRLW